MENKKEININEMEEMFKNIKARCPIYIFNFNQESKQSIIGMYLMCFEEKIIEEKIKNKVMMDDVNLNSWLFFERHHIIELAEIVYGMFLPTKKYIGEKYYEDTIINFILECTYKPIKYSDLINKYNAKIDIIYSTYNIPENIINRLKCIIKYIWFLPYGAIDYIASEAIDLYKNSIKKDENNNEKND